MSPSTLFAIKVSCGTLVVIALVINFFERRYAPHTLLLESSPRFPSWLGWLGWSLASLAALAYFYIDVTT